MVSDGPLCKNAPVHVLAFSFVHNAACLSLVYHANMWNRSSLVCSHPKGFHMCNKLFIVWVIVPVPISADARSKTGLHFCLLQILPNPRMFWCYPLVTNLVFFKELLPEDMSLSIKNEVPLCSIRRYNAFYFHFFTQTTFCIKCHFTYTNYSSPCRKRRFAITLCTTTTLK